MRVLFERGAFTTVDSRATAGMLSALALGLPAYVLIKVLHPSFFAREDTKTPMIFACISMAANAALSFVLFVVLGAVGIAAATAIAGWINVALLVTELRRRAEFRLDPAFRRAIVGIVLATAAMGLAVWALVAALNPWFAPERGIVLQATALVGVVGGGLLTYLLVGALFGAMKPRTLLKDLLGR